MNSRIWDITQTLRAGMPVWPGDTEYSEAPTWNLTDNCPVNVSKFSLSTHAGTHADAQLHYDAGGRPIGMVALDAYIGPCRAIDLSLEIGVVGTEQLKPFLRAVPPRVLIRTYRASPQDKWDAEFRAISADSVDLLASRGVVLVGTDTPSLDPQESSTLVAHHAVRRHAMAIPEGLVLDDVSAGDYELIALPLKLETPDASPVRAILRRLP